jgi:hypothetical protein
VGPEECDLFGEFSGCDIGEACVPYVDYPDGPCEVEIFGTICVRAGTGVQGDSCEEAGCSDGYICVITGRGTHCVEACPLQVGSNCPSGLICQPVDIQGVGACLPP